MSHHLVSRIATGVHRRSLPLRLAVRNLTAGATPPSGRPVAIIGNGRSGTSWIGETVGSAPGVVYYREPCHPQVRYRRDDTVWSRYVPPDGTDVDFESCLDRAFRGGYVGDPDLEPALREVRRAGDYRVVVKEVAAFLSAEWLCRRYDPLVVLALRHPCPSVMSVHRLGLVEPERRRFAEMLANPALREGVLAEFIPHLEQLRDPLEVSAGIWALKNHVALDVAARRGDWIQVTYEEACLRPLETFRGLFEKLGLEWTAAVEAGVVESTSTAEEGPHATSKISSRQVDAWRARMSDEEKAKVRRAVEPFGFPFYNRDEDWR